MAVRGAVGGVNTLPHTQSFVQKIATEMVVARPAVPNLNRGVSHAHAVTISNPGRLAVGAAPGV